MRHAHTPAISALRTSRLTRYFVVPLMLLALLSGCYKWTAGGVGQVRPDNPRTVRVTTMDLSVRVLENAVVSGDSLTGVDEAGERAAIHVGEMFRIETKTLDPSATVAVVGVAFLAVAAATWALVCSGEGGSGGFICP